MKAWCATVVLLLVASGAFGIDSGDDFADPILQARYERLIHDLRCLVCQNESIADSNAGLAADLRREVREMLRAGKSDAQILSFMTDRYGDFVLFRPPFVARTWVLWLAPALLLGVGAWIAVRIVRQRDRLARADADDSDLDSGPA
ncbi:MAG TPA: cytochrome c-type biogenesis protein [Steroidobacteraceae bacterium]|nr:cytochrome c-type biogenesis protein [Steroidobacteraceae bacterium]